MCLRQENCDSAALHPKTLSQGAGNAYEKKGIPAKQDQTATWKNATLTIKEKKDMAGYFLFKLEVSYSGENFLAVDEEKIATLFIHPEHLCYNNFRSPSHYYFSPGYKNEFLTVTFPTPCYASPEKDKILLIEKVLTEYPIVKKNGGTITLKISPESKTNPNDQEG